MLLARVPEGLAPQHDGDCFVECIVAQPNLGRRAGVGFDGVQEEESAEDDRSTNEDRDAELAIQRQISDFILERRANE